MKYLLILATVLVSSLAQAATKPNLFTCTDATGTINISYSTTSFTGDSLFNYAQLPGTRAEISISAMNFKNRISYGGHRYGHRHEKLHYG